MRIFRMYRYRKGKEAAPLVLESRVVRLPVAENLMVANLVYNVLLYMTGK